MRVRRNTPTGDWAYGRSLRDYATGEEAIRQNLVTRIKSFQFDWYLDTSAHVDWFDLLGRKGTQEEIKREVERVAIATDGVVKVDKLELIKLNRQATIHMEVTTIFNRQLAIDLGIEQ
jgi:hypothetical protein